MGMLEMSKTRPETKCDNEAAEKLKPRQRIRKRASTKFNSDFCWFLDPKQRFLYKSNCFWDVFGMIFEGVFEPSF